eukprot:756023-Hanusia_phi.AAC.7
MSAYPLAGLCGLIRRDKEIQLAEDTTGQCQEGAGAGGSAKGDTIHMFRDCQETFEVGREESGDREGEAREDRTEERSMSGG